MWHGDHRFTPEQRAAIREGEAWIARQGEHEPGGVDFDHEPDGKVHAWTIERADVGADGLCSSLHGTISIRSVDLSTLPGLTAHEMAHCRYGFVDGYREGDMPTDGIMRVLTPMRWTQAEEEQCNMTNCRGTQ